MKVALTTYGIPFPIPHFIDTTITNELRGRVLEEVSSMVIEVVKDSKDDIVSNSIEMIDNSLNCLNNSEISPSRTQENIKSLQNETHELYSQELHRLLFELENKNNDDNYYCDWKPKYTGLDLEISEKDGTISWISKEGKDKFMNKGKESFQ